MNSNLNFAMTFPPAKDLIINLLRVADGCERTTSELHEYTGIPGGVSTGKLKPLLDYAQSMGLLNYVFKSDCYLITRTPLGEKIYIEDFSMNEELTLQLLNYNMSSNTIGTEVWNMIVRSIVINGITSISILYSVLEKKYGKNTSAANRIITPFKSAQDNFFQLIGFTNITTDKIRFNNLALNRSFVYMYAYTLFFDWDIMFPEQRELTFEDIKNKIQWGLGFGWDEQAMFQALQLCADHGLVNINKQLSPMTIVRNLATSDTLGKIYDLL